MNEPSDKDLLLGYVRQRDDAAFASLVRRHADLVFGSALRLLGERGAAEEVAQNVFTALARKAHWLTGEGSLAGWLYRTTVLEVRFRQRTDARRRERENTALDLGTTMNPEDSLLKSLVPLLDDGLMELSEKDRHALICRFFEDKSLREVGAMLGTGEDAAQKRVSKSLHQLTRFFRRHGYTAVTTGIVARTLHAAGSAAPPELMASLASAALAASATGTLTTFTLMMGKLMSLTKLQTTAWCVLIGAAPLGYEWHSAGQSRDDQAALQQQIVQSHREFEAEQRQHALLRRRVQAASDSIAAARRETERLRDVIALAGTGNDAGLYLWSEEADYVRLPKSLASKIVLSSSHGLPGGLPPQRDQEAPISANGSLSDALRAALGVTALEQDSLAQTFTDFRQSWREADTARTYATNLPPTQFQVGNAPTRTVITPSAPPEEIEQWRSRFNSQLTSVLGGERAEVLLKQATSMIRDAYRDFGAIERVQTVAFHDGDEITTWNMERRPGESAPLSWGSSSGPLTLDSVPEKLRPYVADWRAQHPKSVASQP